MFVTEQMVRARGIYYLHESTSVGSRSAWLRRCSFNTLINKECHHDHVE